LKIVNLLPIFGPEGSPEGGGLLSENKLSLLGVHLK